MDLALISFTCINCHFPESQRHTSLLTMWVSVPCSVPMGRQVMDAVIPYSLFSSCQRFSFIGGEVNN